ncbi:hypothetical protein PPERSA_05617 [Pseudocohnilembus persalinus]|uniref:RING-type domain-containing protein n=1 Tax=Pseudocohnilembus persalinus TaxID=266149 RepID=A0A0V0QG50_PSEPJ|nr:hypothetical protein PPERSA_05617 [Pseudocohnilembus persalinus]|eukprot:KRX01217.1 hypothetical protein PPERSA_05617 [Pseudocohnilembus persalinus]
MIRQLRGDPIQDPFRGLNDEELQKLEHKNYQEHMLQIQKKSLKQKINQEQNINHFNSHQNNTEEEQDFCPICFVNYEENDKIIILPKCQHYTHQECIEVWLKNSPVCPFCRNNVLVSLYS